jgi:anti-sigma factor RsiW
MNCRETRPLLPLFFDGELEGRQMRAVALHSTRCPDCEDELRRFERVQEVVVAHVDALVEEVDLGQIWAGVAPRLESRAPSLPRRLRTWWEEWQFGWMLRGPAFVAAAAAILLALASWQTDRPTEDIARPVDNTAVVDSMQSSSDSVALMTDEETNTMLLWVMDEGGSAVEAVDHTWEGSR